MPRMSADNPTPSKQTVMQKILGYRPDFLIVLIVLAVIAAVIVPLRGQVQRSATGW